MKRYTFNTPHDVVVIETNTGSDYVMVQQKSSVAEYAYPISRTRAAKLLTKLRKYLVEENDE